MYDDNGRRRFSILRLILICLAIAFLIFLIMWLVAKVKQSSRNCNDTNDSNVVFNNNISYLQSVGTDYFTVDKLPKNVGETVIITLQELLDRKYILQITDKDGKLCSGEDSYVSVTKTETGYEMKTLLVCENKGDFIIKELGCHDLCNNKCNSCPDVTEYEFSKTISKNVTSYSCPNGYKRNGNKCTLTKLIDTKNPTVKTATTTDTKTANKVVVSGTKTKVDTVVTTKTEVVTEAKTEKVYTDSTKKTTENCKQVTEQKPGCVVECKTVYQGGKPSNVCNSCTVTYNKCDTVNSWVCPSGYNSSGSGESLKCWKYNSIPAVTKTTKSYSCPDKANYREGKDENLKCYVVTDGKYTYNCNGFNGYTLSGTNCVKTTTTKTNTCPNGYKLENNKCNKYSTTTKKATSKTSKKNTTEYKWSTSETLSGWTRTGKTRLVADKTCKK